MCMSAKREFCQFLNSAFLLFFSFFLVSFQCTSAVSLLLQSALLSQLPVWHCAALDGAVLTRWASRLVAAQLAAGAQYAPPAQPQPALPAPPAATAWAAAWASMWQLQRQRAHPEMAKRRPRAGDNLKVGSYTHFTYTNILRIR